MVATPFAANLRHTVAVIWGRLGLMKGRAAFSMVATTHRGRLPVLTTHPHPRNRGGLFRAGIN